MNPAPQIPHTMAPRRRRLDPRLITSGEVPDLMKELFVSTLTKVRLILHDKPKDVVVTSLDMEAGKSTVAANLAIAAALGGAKTVLIDGDIRRGVQHNTFTLKKKPGLSEWLSNSTSRAGGIETLLQCTHVPGLALISSGHNASNPTTLLSSQRFCLLKESLNRMFDMVILDTPPLGVGADAVLVHELFSGYVLVARAGKTNIMDMNRKVAEFGPLKAKVLGVVLNRGRIDERRNYYYYSAT